MKKISIFGFTGNLGTQALDILKSYKNQFEFDIFVCDKNLNLAESIVRELNPKSIYFSWVCQKVNLLTQQKPYKTFLKVVKKMKMKMMVVLITTALNKSFPLCFARIGTPIYHKSHIGFVAIIPE